LRAIDGFSRILLEDYNDQLDAEGKRLLNVVRSNTQRMSQLIDDILHFSRAGRTALTYSEIDMNELVHQVLEELKSSMDGRNLTLNIAPLPLVNGDQAMLHQVIENLLTNAIKFTGSTINAHIEIGCKHEDATTTFFVRDNGVGFDMQYVDKLFGVFQRLHGVTEFEGTGIGLAIAKRVINRHGGQIWAEAELNKGATFYFSLPDKESNDEQRK
jgi:two-component system sensor kinase